MRYYVINLVVVQTEIFSTFGYLISDGKLVLPPLFGRASDVDVSALSAAEEENFFSVKVEDSASFRMHEPSADNAHLSACEIRNGIFLQKIEILMTAVSKYYIIFLFAKLFLCAYMVKEKAFKEFLLFKETVRIFP